MQWWHREASCSCRCAPVRSLVAAVATWDTVPWEHGMRMGRGWGGACWGVGEVGWGGVCVGGWGDHYSVLSAQCSLLAARYWLLVACYWLLSTDYSLLTTHYSPATSELLWVVGIRLAAGRVHPPVLKVCVLLVVAELLISLHLCHTG